MSTIMKVIHSLSGPCSCGRQHETAIRDIRIGSGLVHSVGQILRENDFPRRLLLVADRNTLKAAEGIRESLADFSVDLHLFDDLRVATMEEVTALEVKLEGKDCGVLSVGTGSLNDICRLAAARRDKRLCLFATAPSMDGFASYSAPIVAGGFKMSYPARSPEIIIGDTAILAKAPSHLKSAGFGDMIAKYVGLADWRIAHLLTGEAYCDRVAALTRNAVDELLGMADTVTCSDENTAGKIFEALLKTGVGMSFMQNSRPASGSEHIIAHLMECLDLLAGKVPHFHGDDVGVCTLAMLRYYEKLAALPAVTARRETIDWEAVYDFYGPLRDDVRALNHPTTVTDEVDPERLEALWPEIRRILEELPSYETCRSAMERAGCHLTPADVDATADYFARCVAFSPFMRRRLTLLRLVPMLKNAPEACGD